MEIPTPYIFKIETPVLLYNKHLFQLGKETTNDDNFMKISEKKFDLTEIVGPKELEDLYFDNNKELFEQYKQNFISKSMHKIYLSAEKIELELRNNRTLSLILNEILPVITSVKVDNQLDAALNDKAYNSGEDIRDIFSNVTATSGRVRALDNSEIVDKTKDELIKKIEEEYANVGIKKSTKPSLEDDIARVLMENLRNLGRANSMEPSILIDELLGGKNLLLIENRVYELCTVPKLMSEFRSKISDSYWKEITSITSKINPLSIVESVRKNYNQIDSSIVSRIINKLRSASLNIDGNYFFPLYYNENAEIMSDYKNLLEKKLKIDSVNHAVFQAESIRKIEEEKSRLSKLVNTKKFELNGAGFEKINDSYYVFITTPEYVLKSPHNHLYYKFGRAKIGVEIIDSGSNRIQVRDPVVINEYKHPFLRGQSTFQSICMGQYNTENARRLPPGQAVLTILTKAQENLMLGYKTGSNPHNSLTDNKFESYKISKDTFEKSGLVCLNDYKR